MDEKRKRKEKKPKTIGYIAKAHILSKTIGYIAKAHILSRIENITFT